MMSVIKLHLILSAFLLLFTYLGFSQFSFYKNYTVNDGLPSSKIYDMIQDSMGYMWFATENGVARYDGYEFKVLTAQQGLPDNSTLKLYQDYEDRIWFLSYTGKISYYENEKITEHWINDSIAMLNINFFDNIYVDTLDNVWVSLLYGGIYKLSDSIEYIGKSDFKVRYKNPVFTIYLEDHSAGYILGIVNNSGNPVKEKIRNADSVWYHYFSVPSNFLYHHKKYFKVSDEKYYISLGNNLRCIEDSIVTDDRIFSNSIISLYIDKANNLWISLNFQGVYMYPNCNLDSTPNHYLPGYTVSKIHQDESGAYWFSTTENGVYFVPSFNFKNYNSNNIGLKNEIIYSMANKGNKMFFSTDNKEIYSLTIGNETLTNIKKLMLDGYVDSNINDILVASDGSLWIACTQYLNYSETGERISIDSIQQIYGYDFVELYNKSIIFAVQSGINLYKAGEKIFLDDSTTKYSRIFSLHQTQDSTILFGGFFGLSILKDYDIEVFKKDDPVLKTRISDINSTSSQLWVGTFDNGLVMIEEDSITYLNETNGLSSNRIKVIYVENDNHIWVGTNKGLNHIIIDELANRKFDIDCYTIWDGLPTNEINDIVKIDNVIWLATDKGFVSFYPDILEKSNYSPRLFIEKITVNDKKVSADMTHLDFNYNENHFSFNFKAINFKDPLNLNYYYKLEGLEENWLKTKNISVRFPDLEPGDYNFVVKAKNIDGIWSKPVQFEFRIKKHYSQTVLFIMLMILLGMVVLFLIFYSIFISFRNRERLKRQVLLAEQTAIRSQMNPHFIFNSLNSIQSFIIQQDAKNANLYLSNLSKLMRRILENSKKTSIPLREEIEHIRLYLDLEKFRFEKHFDFNLEIDPLIRVGEMVIPSMIIQPYIENAIWHGLVPRKEKGMLQLIFRSLGDHKLLVVIEDNGIGREEAAQNAHRRKNYKSTGMKNTQERIELLNKLYSMNMAVTVIDLHDDNNNPLGTKIELLFE